MLLLFLFWEADIKLPRFPQRTKPCLNNVFELDLYESIKHDYRRRIRMKRTLLLAICMLLVAILIAQSSKWGTIEGFVRDQKSAPIEKVNVKLLRNNKEISNAITNAKGYFLFAGLAEGQYDLVYTKEGFAGLTQKGHNLKKGKKISLKITLNTKPAGKLGTEPPKEVHDKIAISDDLSAPGLCESRVGTKTDANIQSGSSRTTSIANGGAVGVPSPYVTNSARPYPGNELHYDTGRIAPGNTDEFGKVDPSGLMNAQKEPLSTFSIDVDTGSYSIVRKILNENRLPDPRSFRTEELINYFDYDYPDPKGKHPFEVYTELSRCPWNDKRLLLHIGIQAKKIAYENTPPANYVFLIDISGSMDAPNRLPLVKSGMLMLLDQLRPTDRVAIVTYANNVNTLLESTPVRNKETIAGAIKSLIAAGGTRGGDGIQRAYRIAKENYIKGGNNRIILCTDGDFNIGISDTNLLVKMIEEKRNEGIFISAMGFGMGNYKDHRLEQIANKGNGNYAYIDNIMEAKKVFIRDISAVLYTIAKDVKIQVEFNPANVKAYRLIGYENRMLAAEDFKDDTKDAGELGAGHTVTALYEIIPASSDENYPDIDDLKYQPGKQKKPVHGVKVDELLTVKLRYKHPNSDTSIPLEKIVTNKPVDYRETSDNFRFAAAVTGFSMLLQNSPHKGNLSWEKVRGMAQRAKGSDNFGYRAEFIRMVETAELLKKN